MKYEVFERVIALLKKSSEIDHALYKAGLDVANITDDLHTIITHLIGSIYGDDGGDTFSWWCHDKEWGTRTDLTMTDADGNSLCETMEDLYQYLEENKNDDYRLRIPMTDEERMETFRALFK